MSKKIEKMTTDELVEIDELLACIDEEALPMDASEADGFMTALQLVDGPVETKAWIEQIFSTNGTSGAGTGSAADDKRLRSLLIKRFKQIRATMEAGEPLDPVYFELEDDNGRSVQGKEAIEALQPFALGFLEAAQKWSGILDSESRQIALSLHGILRHLPYEALGDFLPVKEALDKEAPLEDLPSALSDMVSCIAEIAHETKGYDLPALNEPIDGEEKV